MQTTKEMPLTATLYVLCCLALAGSCGGGTDADTGASPGPCDAPFDTSLSGTWEITETELQNTCEDQIEPPEVEDVTVDQAGSTILVTSDDGAETFQLCGNELMIPGGTEPEHGGVTTTDPHVLTFTSPTSFTGTATWSWTDGANVCSGSYMLEGTKR